MFVFATVISLLLVASAFIHFVTAFYFRTIVMLRPEESSPENDYGLATIILSVRGCDPGLKKALIRLLDQDYQNYEIHLVVDHRKDNAWQVVQEVKEEFDHDRRLTIHEMKKPLKTCGLKCSSLVQALDHVHPNSKYLVLVDADVTPHTSWLSQLLAPLSDKKIGVVTGNQWFEPQHNNIGSMVRSLWYAGALVPTAIYSNPWAGSFAMRMEDVRRAKLAKIWKKSIVDDGPIREAIKPLGLRIHFSPSLIMINRDRCTLGFVGRYVARTLTWSKMYEPTFLNTIFHCVATVGLLLLSFVFLTFTAIDGNWPAAWTIVAGLLGACVFNFFSYTIVRSAVSTSSNLENRELDSIGIWKGMQLFALSPVAYAIYGYACLQAALCQKIQWRQITYELKGKSNVKMLRYRPWVAKDAEEEQAKISI